MARYILRVWLPDRPGALGALTSQLGAIGGDLIEIQILERIGGQAIDELKIELQDNVPVQWLMQELDGIAGLVIEDARLVGEATTETILDAVEVAAKLVAEASPTELITELAKWVMVSFTAHWVAAIQLDPPFVLAAVGPAPESDWLESFVRENESVSESHQEDRIAELIWSSLDAAGIALVVAREGRPFRARERRHLAALGKIAGLHWIDCSWAQ